LPGNIIILLNSFIRQYWIYLILLPLAYVSCQECDDCGPGQNEPFVNLRFYNIDSLLKVEDTLTFIQDSLDTVNLLIKEGDTTLTDTKTELENQKKLYTEVKNNINQGKIRIDEVFGPDGEGPLLFKDSLKNDSLTNFRFPLDMNRDESVFIIHFNGDVNEIGFNYYREVDRGGDFIVVRVYDLQIITHTFDSVKTICNKDQCLSNETTVRIYF
jgi:hypothetical protein